MLKFDFKKFGKKVKNYGLNNVNQEIKSII